MYIVDGIAYAENPMAQIEIIQLKILENRILLLTFNNGVRRLFDASALKGPIFELLQDDDAFATATLEDGIVTWLDGRIDCAPEFMYEHSHVYDEILE